MKRSMMIWIVFSVLLLMELPHVIPCNVSDVDIQMYQTEFEDLVSNEIGMIYVNVSSPSFENFTLNQTEWNKIIDWIWVTEEYKHFLSYPIDIDVFTLGLMKQNVRSLKINVSIENIENCTSDKLWIQVYEHLFEIYNRSNGYFCHRYFKNQDWKETLYRISHASIGYGFHCFQNNDPSSFLTIEKSGIIYITISIVLTLFFYYPMILSPSSHEKQVDRQLLMYTEADYPYTPRRLFLYIVFKTGKIRDTEKVTKNDKMIKSCFGGARSSVLITIVTGLAYILKVIYINKCHDCLPPNAFTYSKVYTFDGSSDTYLLIASSTLAGFIFLAVFNSNILLLSELLDDEVLIFDFLKLRSIPVSCFLQNTQDKKKSESESTKQTEKSDLSISMQIVNRFYLMFSLKFWCNIYLFPLMLKKSWLFCIILMFSPINFMINVCLIVIFSVFPLLNQLFIVYRHSVVSYLCKLKSDSVIGIMLALAISIFVVIILLYSNAIYMGISCIVQFLIYFILVGIPHLYSKEVHIFLLLTAIVTYMSKFFLEFFLLYRLLLQKMIKIKGTKEIYIKDFDTIVQYCCPVTKELFFLFAKVLLTSFLLIIMYLTLNELNFLDSENSFDLNTFLMYVFVLLTPGLLEVLFFESNADKVERMHYELDEQVRSLANAYDTESTGQNIHTNEAETRQTSENDGVDDDDDDECHRFSMNCKICCLCFCGCLETPRDENGHCKYCYTLEKGNGKNNEIAYTTKHFTLFQPQRQRREYENINGNGDIV